jgi:hypothetical protein
MGTVPQVFVALANLCLNQGDGLTDTGKPHSLFDGTNARLYLMLGERVRRRQCLHHMLPG